MSLDDLDRIVTSAMLRCMAMGGDPDDTPVLIVNENIIDQDVDSAVLEEFPDDEETYREHVRCGGKREFTFQIRFGDKA